MKKKHRQVVLASTRTEIDFIYSGSSTANVIGGYCILSSRQKAPNSSETCGGWWMHPNLRYEHSHHPVITRSGTSAVI